MTKADSIQLALAQSALRGIRQLNRLPPWEDAQDHRREGGAGSP